MTIDKDNVASQQASIVIQAAWRGRRTRNGNRRKIAAALVIQRLYRGVSLRSKFGTIKSRLGDLEKHERMRLERLK